jgi:hypothetical protein
MSVKAVSGSQELAQALAHAAFSAVFPGNLHRPPPGDRANFSNAYMSTRRPAVGKTVTSLRRLSRNCRTATHTRSNNLRLGQLVEM